MTATTGGATLEALAGAVNVTGTTEANVTVVGSGGVGLENGVRVTPTTASLLVTNGSGNTHRLIVGETETTLSGGISSTSMTLGDSVVTFSNTSTSAGGPVRVTGVADGANPFDAVNFRQLNEVNDRVDRIKTDAFSGIASVSALAAIPEPGPNKRVAVGVGYGHFKGENAVAGGVKAHLTKNISATAGAGYSAKNLTVNAGVGVSIW